MTLDLSADDLNLILSCIGTLLNVVPAEDRPKLEALQTKLMAARDG